ncbi:hypothetical protein PLESTB_001781700 [Pleodorina starrii]|uniref:Uncharacterized protein n=1 Tax=Pleodorina starrii TaxID=330485 RepID=A0A9W6F9R0_9CHLO|nr:hypothetical protein PLESTM_000803300 [Pleodorina starrii]GLC61604.1 hypothetical protein PLESTB_001781700 [Pleodorina starrii]GLC70216.1 hypothetical protein PLESTF_000939500 [Pleodorina starrii]
MASSLSTTLQRSGSGALPLSPAPRLSRRTSGQLCHSPLSRACSCPAVQDELGLPSASKSNAVDPFTAAGRRLQTLLSRVGDGEDELLNSLVEQESPESKLQTSVILGGCVTIGAVVVASLLGQDPWGGLGPSSATLGAAGVGLAAALPMAAIRMWSWTPAAAQAIPALQDVHDGQLELHRPWLASMDRGQVFTLMALEVLPLTMLLFPAGQAGIMAAVTMYGQLINGSGLEAQSHDTYLTALALVLTALVSAMGRSMELSVSEEEYELVQTAARNADRYYRTMAADLHTSPVEASRAAEAFRFVAQAWLQTKGEASLLAGVITALDVLALGALWHGTGNLAAPALAALAINAVDYWHLHSAVLRKEAKVARHTGSSSGSGGN